MVAIVVVVASVIMAILVLIVVVVYGGDVKNALEDLLDRSIVAQTSSGNKSIFAHYLSVLLGDRGNGEGVM